jgi:hypothetical protein
MRTPLFAFGIALSCASIVVACSDRGARNTSASRTDDHAPGVSTSSITVRPAVAWPATSTVDDGALLSLSKNGAKTDSEIRALVSRSPVPVLAPRDLKLATPTLVVEGEYFALTGRADGATISLQGTRAAHRYEGVDPATGNRDLMRATPVRGFVSINEGIRTASWIENGAAYSVDVECSNVQDTRCTGEDFILSVVAQLTYVGGSGR